MCPYVGLERSRSTGPNVATPSASSARSAWRASSHARTDASVVRGSVVGNSARATMRSGSPSATAHTHDVPPPSTPAPAKRGRARRERRGGAPKQERRVEGSRSHRAGVASNARSRQSRAESGTLYSGDRDCRLLD